MNSEIAWQVELSINPGQLDAFRTLTSEMIETTKLEDDVQVYERFWDGQGSRVFLYERYANSDAAVLHLRFFLETYGQQFSKLVKREHFLVFGTPSGDLKSILSKFSPVILERMGGFSNLTRRL